VVSTHPAPEHPHRPVALDPVPSPLLPVMLQEVTFVADQVTCVVLACLTTLNRRDARAGQIWFRSMGNNDGEEGFEASAVDEGRGAHAEDAGARADEDNCDRAQPQAERGCGVSAGIKAGRDAGRRSRQERGVNLELCS
jgi:hypothetical protein